jgi:hypothetical protein
VHIADELTNHQTLLSLKHLVMEVNMRALRSVFSILIFLSVILGPFQSASASAATTYQVMLKNVNVPWFSPPPEGLSSFCNEVPEGVHINPDDLSTDLIKHATVVQQPSGGVRVTKNESIKGTATDNFGVSYVFSYSNHATYDYDGGIVTAKMVDVFSMHGGEVHFTVSFNWGWQYVSTTGLEVVPIVEDGQTVNLEVVPFAFPTDDGITETTDPSYIPGSWVIHSYNGDVWNCDQL